MMSYWTISLFGSIFIENEQEELAEGDNEVKEDELVQRDAREDLVVKPTQCKLID